MVEIQMDLLLWQEQKQSDEQIMLDAIMQQMLQLMQIEMMK